jgi:hypothetical protein
VPWFVNVAPFIPILAMIPPSLAAVWIAKLWLKSRGTSADLAAVREEIAELRQVQADMQERIDFTERLLSQVREAQRDLPRGAP